MDDKILMYKSNSITLCNKLLRELEANKDDVNTFLGGEMNELYIHANDKAVSKTRRIRNKIRNLY